MSTYQQFIFKDYRFDKKSKSLNLYYDYDGILSFNETYHFDFDFVEYDELVLDRALQLLFLMAGVSYFKAYLSPSIRLENCSVDEKLADFLSKTYQKGLREFFYVNKINPLTTITFPTNSESFEPLKSSPNKELLVGIGGGKDSLVTVELLRELDSLSTWSVNHRPQLTPLVKKIGLPHFWVERKWDHQLLKHNEQGALNGHIPISAILACVGLIVAVLSGKSDIVVSNEQSANEPTLNYEGIPVNHQYSKSQEFEIDFQKILLHAFGDSYKYYSFLRPLSEIRIAEIFSKIGFDKYKNEFNSCNRAFIHTSDSMSWCGECPKCAFTFLALTPFLPRPKLENLFKSKNLLLDPRLEKTYEQLLGINGPKPLECVGDIKESREAMYLSQKIYPELEKYKFDLTKGYDFREFNGSSMPDWVHDLLTKVLKV